MSVPAMIMWAVVAGIGFPAAFRNWTALALCGAWLVSELAWLLTEENLPLLIYFILDYCVLLVIFIKQETCDLSPYRTFADQLKAIALERSKSDVFIAAIFPMMWLVYVVDIEDYYRWWVLWGLVQLQFLAFGEDAYRTWKAVGVKIWKAKLPGMFKLGFAGHG